MKICLGLLSALLVIGFSDVCFARSLYQEVADKFAQATPVNFEDVPEHAIVAGYCANDAKPDNTFAGLLCLSRTQDPLNGRTVSANFAYDDLGKSIDLFTKGSLNYSPHPCESWEAFRSSSMLARSGDMTGGQMILRRVSKTDENDAYWMLRSHHNPRGYVAWTSVCWFWVDRTNS